jgi:hypothetical protein
MNAINSAAKYGLENLNTIHDVFSLGFNNSQVDKAIIAAPNMLAVAI